jgi:endonuclease/exonuclease/phosphatase family metal-dependent hydrolase
MRLLSFNLWGGRGGDKLFEYLKQQSQVVDVFCFQEVLDTLAEIEQKDIENGRIHLLDELKELLPEYIPVYSVIDSGHGLVSTVDFPLTVGLLTLVKKNYSVEATSYWPIFGGPNQMQDEENPKSIRGLQQTIINISGQLINVFNFHGVAQPGDKLDTPARLHQSKTIAEILAGISGPKILCGDFNLMPQTESVKILASNQRNLIKDFNIQNTRNQISWDMFKNKQYFADFTFVSPEIQVKNFEVPYNEVSDHLPMILDFNL